MLIGVMFHKEDRYDSCRFTWDEGMIYYSKEETTYYIYVEKPEEITIDQWKQIRDLTPKRNIQYSHCDSSSYETTTESGSLIYFAREIAKKLGPEFAPTDDFSKLIHCELFFSPFFQYCEPVIRNFPVKEVGITLSLPNKIVESSKLPLNESSLRQTGLYIRKLIIAEGVTSFKAIGYATKKYAQFSPLRVVGNVDIHRLDRKSEETSAYEELSLNNYSWPDYCISIEEIVFPKSLKALPNRAFQNFSNLRKIQFSEGLQVIPNYAFTGCCKLSEIVLPKSITKICRGAFSDCSELKRVAVPDTLVDVELKSFDGCNNIEYIVVYQDDKHGYKTSLKEWLYNLRKEH